MPTRPAVLTLALMCLACKSESGSDEQAADAGGATESSDAGGSESETGASAEGSDDTGTGEPGETGETGETGEPAEDPVLEADDFGCVLDMPKVRRFHITNVLGDLDATLAVADSPTGGEYPTGTLIQLVPTEAMVKRAPGFAPEANDWEFFSLAVSADGTQILERGASRVVNAFGGNCFGCHVKAEPQWDFICETDHGCDPLPFTAAQIEAIQNSDPRCP